eukprot:TRINITY_DN4190_c0_g1_i1.p1 TRINITY_DN4190_c0_g1~~TRINITY_DN4190_c0_g1_i1.p1  ORF type:complete len:332 (+),score=47.48 TRINITY_DN4190_c0_g1_i1:55-1050(+)
MEGFKKMGSWKKLFDAVSNNTCYLVAFFCLLFVGVRLLSETGTCPRLVKAEKDATAQASAVPVSTKVVEHVFENYVPKAVPIEIPQFVTRSNDDIEVVYQQYFNYMKVIGMTSKVIDFRPSNPQTQTIHARINSNSRGKWTTLPNGTCSTMVVIGEEFETTTTSFINKLSSLSYCIWWSGVAFNHNTRGNTQREHIGYLTFLSDPNRPKAQLYVFVKGSSKSTQHSSNIISLIQEAVGCHTETGLYTQIGGHVVHEIDKFTTHVPFIWNRLAADIRPMREDVPVVGFCCGQFVVSEELIARCVFWHFGCFCNFLPHSGRGTLKFLFLCGRT